MQDLLGEEDEDPRPLEDTRFDSVAAQIRDGFLALLVPELGAEASPGKGGPAPAPEAVARFLRALADLLDGGRER